MNASLVKELMALADKWEALAHAGLILEPQETIYECCADELRTYANTLAAREVGFVLVPIEPTQPMIEAAAKAAMRNSPISGRRLKLGEILTIEYKAMLAAAPKASPSGEA